MEPTTNFSTINYIIYQKCGWNDGEELNKYHSSYVEKILPPMKCNLMKYVSLIGIDLKYSCLL